MPVSVERIAYRGWQDCRRISNGEVEIVVTGDVGPRLIRYGFAGGQNLFKEFDAQMGKGDEPEWQPRGGHRIWIAPEDPVDTYAPDNVPVRIEENGVSLIATAPVEPLTSLEKALVVEMDPAGTGVTVRHTIRNAGAAPRRLAPWALTMLEPGGYGIHGFPPRGTHPEVLAPTNPLVMWAFTDLADPRWTYTRKYLVLHGDTSNPTPMKLGSWNSLTWGVYLLNGEAFVKRFDAPGKPEDYTDFGCSFETFTNGNILELETLGPLSDLPPGRTVEHIERWTLHRNVRVDAFTDEILDRVVLPLI
jgi:hypothetical protein